MPVRIAPPAQEMRLKFAREIPGVLTYTLGASGNLLTVEIDRMRYVLDVAKADSVGKQNMNYPDRAYAFDGDLDTTGSFLTTDSLTYVPGDAGVDMGRVDGYLVYFKVGYYNQSTADTYVAFEASPDLANWYALWSARTNYSTEQISTAHFYVTSYRAFRFVFRTGRSGVSAAMRTYEIAVFRI